MPEMMMSKRRAPNHALRTRPVKTGGGLEHRTDIVTALNLIDLSEGREHERVPGGVAGLER